MLMKDSYIEKIDATNVHILSEVALRAYADHYLHLWYDQGKWYVEKFFSVDRLTTEINDKNSCFYIAFFNSSPVGFLKLNINAPLEGFESKDGLELERIYLKKEVIGKGIGRKLVELTIEIAEKFNKNFVWLKAMDTSQEPIEFYKKMGFAITGTYRLKHELMKKELRGMVIMAKNLAGK